MRLFHALSFDPYWRSSVWDFDWFQNSTREEYRYKL